LSTTTTEEVNMEVTKEQALKITNEIRSAVEKILAENGLAAPKIKTSYGDIYKLVVETSVEEKDASGVNIKSPEAIYYTRFGYTVYHVGGATVSLTAPLGTAFSTAVKGSSAPKNYIFAGIAASRQKFPIVALEVGKDGKPNGKTMFFTESVVPKINASAK
jgi:hypothetical protein